MRIRHILISLMFVSLTVAAPAQVPVPQWVTCFPSAQLPRAEVQRPEMIVPEGWRPKHVNWNLDANHNYVEDSLEGLNPESAVDVTVALNHVTTPDDLTWLRSNGTIRYAARYSPIVFLASVRVRDLVEIAADPRVAHIEKKRNYRWMTDRSIQNIRVQSSTTYPGTTLADACPGIDGSGINIAIIDSGVDDPGGPGITHSALPTASFGYNAVTDVETNPDDDVGHGTHVAHIALGRPNLGFRGVAPGAGLIDMKVGSASPLDYAIADAIEKCMDKKTAWNCRVINLSLGDCSVVSDGKLAGDVNIDNAVAAGIVVSVAMGNAGSPCPSAGTPRVGTPAGADKAITVQLSSYESTVTRVDDTIGTPIYLRGPRISDGDADTLDELKPDVTAPGMASVTPFAGIRSAKFNTPGLATTDYFAAAGTSMASPHVAGFAALLLQVNPTLTPEAVKQLIITSAENRGGTGGWQTDWGHGLIDGFTACQTIKAPKTDLQFKENCSSPTPTSWVSADLYPTNPIIVEGTPNGINAVVFNSDSVLSSGAFQVELGVHDTSNSTAPYATVCTVNVPSLGPLASKIVSCAWNPNVSLATGDVHACLKARIISFADSNPSNNCAQHNVQIKATMSPATFRFTLVNPTNEDLTVGLRSNLNFCNAGGWTLLLPDDLILHAGDPPRVTEVVLDPGTTGGAKVVHVETVGTAADGRELSLGGVTLVAQTKQITDCNRNGVDDAAELELKITTDGNHDGLPDNCQFAFSRRRSVRSD